MRNIIVFGHDPRMESVAGYFYHLGYDVYENPEEPVADACVITAPKLSEAEEEILCAYMTDDQILYHGLLSAASWQKLQEKGVTCHPYLQLETLVTENAQLTAQGILSIAGRRCRALGKPLSCTWIWALRKACGCTGKAGTCGCCSQTEGTESRDRTACIWIPESCTVGSLRL